jgi:lysophospholipase L1-like esterase
METVMIRRKAHTPSTRLVEESATEREDATPGHSRRHHNPEPTAGDLAGTPLATSPGWRLVRCDACDEEFTAYGNARVRQCALGGEPTSSGPGNPGSEAAAEASLQGSGQGSGQCPGQPPLRGRRRAAGAALSIAGIALLLTACSSVPDQAPAPIGTPAAAGAETTPGTPTASPTPMAAQLHGSYVALGDSFTAGPDIPYPTGPTGGCGQSNGSYPYLVARRLGLQLTDMSCSSATTTSLTAPQPTGDGTNPAQLSTLSTATRLVTLGIGGNDVGWTGIITRCTELDLIPALMPGSATSDLTPCQDYYASGGTDQIQQRIQTVAGQLAQALTQIRQRAPHARVYVVGYPDLFPAAGSACAHTLGITAGDIAFLNTEELRFNAMLQQNARAAGDSYVNTYTPSVGHDACAPEASRWIEPLIPAAPAAPLHPNAVGQQGMADAIVQAIKGTA